MNDNVITESEDNERQQRLNGAYCEVLELCEAGATIDRAALLAKHSDLALELIEFLDSEAFVLRTIDAARPLPLAAGVRVGRFLTSRIISSGPMSIVYQVEDESSPASRPLALKVLPALGRLDPESRARFKREAESVAQFSHSNILPILEIDTTGAEPYILMPLIDGPDLRTIRRELARTGVSAKTYPVANRGSDDDRAALGSQDSHMRAVAMVGEQAARALEHAHQRGILHRDVKPSNLLLDSSGTVFLTDFGLARQTDIAYADLTATGDIPGTLRYLAPERLHGACETRSDVYGLGLTLYELLTLRPVFDTPDRGRLLKEVATSKPPRPSKLATGVPRDLETIVMKAIEKEPTHRYDSASAMALDLRRLLKNEPILARRPTPLDRASRWAGRNLAVVAASFAAMLVVILILAGGVLWISSERKKAVDAARVASQEKQKAIAAAMTASQEKQKAIAAARDSRYESLAQGLLRILWTTHEHGWSDEARNAIHEMAGIRDDERQKTLAMAARRGPDAHFVDAITPGGSSILFKPTGSRLLISSISEGGFRGADRGSAIWDFVAKSQSVTRIKGNGPVAFRADGTPLQLAYEIPSTLQLWDVSRGRVVNEFKIPNPTAPGPDSAIPLEPIYYDRAMAADGSRVAASIKDSAGDRWIFVWDGLSGQELRRFAGHAQRLAFSSDGELLAAGDNGGRIDVWSVLDGVKISSSLQGRLTICSLAFGRKLQGAIDAKREKKTHVRAWRLAAGDFGGNVTVWDVETGMLHVRCTPRGSPVEVVAFSPDGTLLFSGGAEHADVWDVASGEYLLTLRPGGRCVNAAFSPDGRDLAITTLSVGTRARHEDISQVVRWNIENGRGIQTLRALVTPVSQIMFSPGGRYIAALASDWQIAIWDRHTGELKFVLNAPEGITPDNAALAFSADDLRFACCSGAGATLWHLGSGRQLGAWTLPLGVRDSLAFPGSAALTLFRVETRSGKRGPTRDVPYQQDPRVCRIRELLDSGKMRTIAEIPAFNRHVFNHVAPRDLSYVVVDGVNIDAKGEHRSIASFDGTTGKRLWSIPIPGGPRAQVEMNLDPTGQVLSVYQSDRTECDLFRVPSGTPIGSMMRPEALGAGAEVWLARNHRSGAKQASAHVFRRGDDRPILSLGTEAMTTTASGFQFSADGRSLAWANSDGTIDVADLDELQRPMKAIEVSK